MPTKTSATPRWSCSEFGISGIGDASWKLEEILWTKNIRTLQKHTFRSLELSWSWAGSGSYGICIRMTLVISPFCCKPLNGGSKKNLMAGTHARTTNEGKALGQLWASVSVATSSATPCPQNSKCFLCRNENLKLTLVTVKWEHFHTSFPLFP